MHIGRHKFPWWLPFVLVFVVIPKVVTYFTANPAAIFVMLGGIFVLLLLIPLASWSLSRTLIFWREAQDASFKRKNEEDSPKRYEVGDDGELIEL